MRPDKVLKTSKPSHPTTKDIITVVNASSPNDDVFSPLCKYREIIVLNINNVAGIAPVKTPIKAPVAPELEWKYACTSPSKRRVAMIGNRTFVIRSEIQYHSTDVLSNNKNIPIKSETINSNSISLIFFLDSIAFLLILESTQEL
jgi:hypothetical protein